MLASESATVTHIDFHTNVGDPLAYACRLARKAYMTGRPVVILAEPKRLAAFDEQLWIFEQIEFVPHELDLACLGGAGAGAGGSGSEERRGRVQPDDAARPGGGGEQAGRVARPAAKIDR